MRWKDDDCGGCSVSRQEDFTIPNMSGGNYSIHVGAVAWRKGNDTVPTFGNVSLSVSGWVFNLPTPSFNIWPAAV